MAPPTQPHNIKRPCVIRVMRLGKSFPAMRTRLASKFPISHRLAHPISCSILFRMLSTHLARRRQVTRLAFRRFVSTALVRADVFMPCSPALRCLLLATLNTLIQVTVCHFWVTVELCDGQSPTACDTRLHGLKRDILVVHRLTDNWLRFLGGVVIRGNPHRAN